PFAAQFVGDIGKGLDQIGGQLGEAAWNLGELDALVVSQRGQLLATSERLTPDLVVRAAASAAPGVRVTVDAGAHMFPATMLWPVAQPNGMLISNGLSTMGFALPAAIGAALLGREGAPGAIHDHDRPVVALTGDGGLLICAGELLTAVRERLRVITIVFSDGRLSLIDIKQQQRKMRRAGVALGDVDWCRLAGSLGAAAHLVRDERDLERAMARALDHSGPTLIEARIDPGT